MNPQESETGRCGHLDKSIRSLYSGFNSITLRTLIRRYVPVAPMGIGMLVVVAVCATLLLTHCSPKRASVEVETIAGEIFDIPLPSLPCPIQSMAAREQDLLLMDRCGTIAVWNPWTQDFGVVQLENEPAEFFEIAASESAIAVLGEDRKSIYVYDPEGNLLRKH